MYAEYLVWRGIEVREVHSATAALHELATFLPDVVVTDDRLPDSTGQELVRALRRSRHTFDLPIVLLCSDTFSVRDEPIRPSCDLVLMVPLLPESLLNALVSVVDDCRARHSARPFESWLFVREDDSVWIVRTADLELAIAGPGRDRNVYSFAGEQELLAFQAQYEQRLRHTGFALEIAGNDRRSGHDRRRLTRATERRAIQ
jgi:CheY-like chemotaxis protein